MQADLKKRLVFLEEVAVTSLHPDVVLLSRSTKTIMLAEFTVPWEDRQGISHELKRAKYQGLIDEALVKGWHANLFLIKVGCYSFPATSCSLFLPEVVVGTQTAKERHRGDSHGS